MSISKLFLPVCLTLSLVLIGCGDRPQPKPRTNSAKPKSGNTRSTNPMNPYSSNPMNPLTTPTNKLIKTVKGLSTPKDSIVYQLTLLKAGDTEKLKECFTDRQKGKITAEVVEKGKKELADTPLEDLYGSEEMGEYEGNKTCKIKMKGGKRSLTTLVLTEGKWLSDTIWFK